MGSFSTQFSRPLPGPPWSVENGLRARLGACRFLLDAVRSWVQFGLEPSCQGPWIVAVEHVTQTLSFILDGSLPGGPLLSISKREGSRPWIFYMTVAQGWMCPRSCDTRSHVASELAGRRADFVGGVVPGQYSMARARSDVRRW